MTQITDPQVLKDIAAIGGVLDWRHVGGDSTSLTAFAGGFLFLVESRTIVVAADKPVREVFDVTAFDLQHYDPPHRVVWQQFDTEEEATAGAYDMLQEHLHAVLSEREHRVRDAFMRIKALTDATRPPQ